MPIPKELFLSDSFETHDLGEQIPGNEIIDTVTKAVGASQVEICMTMLLSEDKLRPLPEKYKKTLSDALERGVMVTRVGFGDDADFETISASTDIASSNFSFLQNRDVSKYQRMILVDKKQLFFKIDEVFYRSTDVVLISQFLNYFELVKRS